jgi:hypothetical protein
MQPLIHDLLNPSAGFICRAFARLFPAKAATRVFSAHCHAWIIPQ